LFQIATLEIELSELLGRKMDTLVCPHCGGAMRIIAFIDQPDVIEKILAPLGLWPAPAHSLPQVLAA
jgi:hypothetical protein